MKASVKVMNSYDYCHFEVVLSSDQDMSLSEINEMRKKAQRLVDNAVNQYRTAKKMSQSDLNWRRDQAYRTADEIRMKPANEWTPEDKAHMKALSDDSWSRQYDYDDDEGLF